MTSYIAVSLLILAISIPTVSSYLRDSDFDSKSEDCGQHNGSCIDCISATRLNMTQLCYFCGNSCLAAGFTSLTPHDCYLSDYYVGQCNLNLLSILVLVVMACLCCSGTCCLCVILVCCCCCCRTRKPKPVSHPKHNYNRIVNRDSLERQKMREERAQDIKERYAL